MKKQKQLAKAAQMALSGRSVNYREIPKGAIKIAHPAIQQPDNYSCGAGAMMSAAARIGVGPERIEEFKAGLKTNPEHGTYYRDILDYAKSLGLNAALHIGMTKRQLKKLLEKQYSIILSMQAYADDPVEYDDPSIELSGHYILAEGFDDEDYFYFMDPSLHGRRGFMSWPELRKRWHENEGSAKVESYSRLAIVIGADGHKPIYDYLARHID